MAGIGHGQGVFDHILSQGLRRIFGSGVDFRDVVQAHLGQHWCFCHHLAHLCLGLYHLLGASNVAHGLEDAGQILALWRSFSQALHDSADFRNLGQAFHPVFHLIEVGHGLDELRCHAGISQLLGHAQHLICHGHKCLGHVAGSAQLGLQFFRQQALCHILLVGITKGECCFQCGHAIELCCLGSIVQRGVALDRLCGSNVELLLGVTNLCCHLGVLAQVCGHWNQGLGWCKCVGRSWLFFGSTVLCLAG